MSTRVAVVVGTATKACSSGWDKANRKLNKLIHCPKIFPLRLIPDCACPLRDILMQSGWLRAEKFIKKLQENLVFNDGLSMLLEPLTAVNQTNP